MCVIIHKPAGVVFSPDDVRGAFESNSHGFGVMYLDKDSGEVVAKKKLLKDVPSIQKIFEDLKDEDAVFHFRIKTHGPTNDMFCHPFKVLDKKLHGHSMWMMHNGIINKAKNASNESDTYAYVRDVLTEQLKKDFDRVEDEWFQEKVEAEIGYSKLVFLDETGRIVIYNRRQGDDYKGCWVSNKGFVRTTHTNYAHNQNRTWDPTQQRFVYDDEHHSSRGPTEPVKTVFGVGTLCKLRGTTIKPAQRVHLFNVLDTSFYAMGTITDVSVTTFSVQYTDKDKCTRISTFFSDGATGAVAGRRLQAIPECFGIEQATKTFMETEFWDNPVLALEDKRPTTLKKERTDMIELTEEEKKGIVTEEDPPFGTAITHEGNPLLQYLSTSPVDVMMEAKDYRYGGGDVDAFDVYGGEPQVNCPEVCLLDIYNMDPQDRMDWFFRYPEIAFAIFQDLVEQVVLDDPGVKHDGEEDESDLPADTDEDEESVDASRATGTVG